MNENTTKQSNTGKNPKNGQFLKGNKLGGRKPDTPEQKLIKKANKQFIAEYVDKLSEALVEISPVLIAKAIDGDMMAIKEVNDRVIGKPRQNIGLDGGSEGLAINFAPVFNKIVEADIIDVELLDEVKE